MHNRYLSAVLDVSAVLGVMLIGAFVASSAYGETAMDKPLYDRLGGYDAISAVVDDFAAKLFKDPVVGARFFGMSDDSREGFRQKNKNLVCAATGGPCKIISRTAATPTSILLRPSRSGRYPIIGTRIVNSSVHLQVSQVVAV